MVHVSCGGENGKTMQNKFTKKAPVITHNKNEKKIDNKKEVKLYWLN